MIKKIYRSILPTIIALSMPLTFLTGAAPDNSLYQLPLSWQSESGIEAKLSQFSGKPVILTLMYTRCGSTCPMTIGRLKTIERQIKDTGASPTFVLVSLDPKEDTPERLDNYKKAKGLGDNWHLLRGPEQNVRTLSVFLGYSYREDPEQKEIFHSNKIILLDADGNVVFTLDGVESDPAPLLKKVAEMAKGQR